MELQMQPSKPELNWKVHVSSILYVTTQLINDNIGNEQFCPPNRVWNYLCRRYGNGCNSCYG